MFILFKIKYNNGEFSSIGKVQRINKTDKNWYIDFILENMKFKSEYYNENQIESFIFSYGIKAGKIKDKDIKNVNVIHQKYKNLKLPISMEAKDYGRLIVQNKIETGINYILQNEKGETIDFKKYEKYNEVECFKNGISLVKFTDIFINKVKFLRKIENKYLYFENGRQILSTKEMKTKFISKTKKTNNLINNFITLDIETFVDNNVLVPYLISFYDGKRVYPFGLWDYKNPEMMILDCLKSLFIRKYDGYKIYIHNMAKFDIIFLLKYIVKVAIVHPVIHNSRIISLHVNCGEKGDYQIQFKDSYLLLLSSLAKLTRGFGVDTLKSVFPYLFVKKNNLDYIGEVPDFKYFDNKITLNEYNEYKNNFNWSWNLRKEVLKYCEIDCVSLYQLIFKFSDLIFSQFGKNIHHYPTLPSLAFAIFRSNFMENENIPQITGKIADDIRSGYTGGAVDVYIPKPPKNRKIKCYDVNSLYPSVMFKNFMPIGFPTYFEGDIRIENPEAFGFFYCKIKAPDNIKHPIIQTHVKINGIVRTIAPIGEWTDMLFSMEMDNAQKYGYKFEILWGYTFEKAIIFGEYVNFLYTLRNEYPKSHPLNFIAKILLNSLYGRFGMDDNFPNIQLIHKNYLTDFENKFFDQIEEKIDLGEHMLVFYKNIDKSREDNSDHNISIPIAAAITAYARIHMSQFKNNPKINLYYTDTDSIFTDSEIDDSLISEKDLGKLKLENTCEKAIFLTPKVYCLKTESGEFIYKVKGLKHEIELTMHDFELLLKRDSSLKKSQVKWRRNLTEAKISLLKELYTLKVNDNKRELIYNRDNKFVGTKAYKIDKTKNIKTR
uniref:DNA polymerase n=1 Tax=Russula lepida TaxID=152963 RepID=A0A2S0U3Y3_9AGAM|nr:hypothetical protein [Russula lepida]AWB36196.1 hypothetical protein [Russula lepida]